MNGYKKMCKQRCIEERLYIFFEKTNYMGFKFNESLLLKLQKYIKKVEWFFFMCAHKHKGIHI